MGNTNGGPQTIISNSDEEIKLEDYAFVKSIQDGRYGTARMYRHKTTQEVIIAKTRNIDDTKFEQHLITAVKRRGPKGKIFHPNLNVIKGHSVLSVEGVMNLSLIHI
eukprot:TRINITY_DN9608_c0_g1_i3.p1 TRINITY_DN9608_c0_g1~~TRINITY_DN9608_c0_g1_i3.p1  ORF type:complete len:107 (-),score=12.80 TRINITY_DN9608_c0_g1_i3:62-382(-)